MGTTSEKFKRKTKGDEFKHIYELLEYSKLRWVELFEAKKFNKHLEKRTVLGTISKNFAVNRISEEEEYDPLIRFMLLSAEFAVVALPDKGTKNPKRYSQKQLSLLEDIGWIVGKKNTFFQKSPRAFISLRKKSDRVRSANFIHSTLILWHEHEFGDPLIIYADDHIQKEKKEIKSVKDFRNVIGRWILRLGLVVSDYREED